MTTRRGSWAWKLALPALSASAAVMVGCGNDATSEAKSITDPVSEAVSSPTGHLSASTAKDVFKSAHSSGSASVATSFIPGGTGAPASPDAAGASYAACTSSSSDGGSVDIACATGGEGSGSVSYHFAGTLGASGYALVWELDDACIKAFDLCLDGKGAETISGSAPDLRVVSAGDLTFTAGSASLDLRYGYELDESASGSKTSFVIFDSKGDSYVLSASASGDSGEVTVKGANGTFQCSWSAAGEQGSCEGSGKFSW